MLGDHIARAMALERQRDLVPEMRKTKRERKASDTESGETGGDRSGSSQSEPKVRARSRL